MNCTPRLAASRLKSGRPAPLRLAEVAAVDEHQFRHVAHLLPRRPGVRKVVAPITMPETRVRLAHRPLGVRPRCRARARPPQQLVFAVAGQVQHAPGVGVQRADDVVRLLVDQVRDVGSPVRAEDVAHRARPRGARRAGRESRASRRGRGCRPPAPCPRAHATAGRGTRRVLSWRTMPAVTAGGRPVWLQRSSSSSHGKRAEAASSSSTMSRCSGALSLSRFGSSISNSVLRDLGVRAWRWRWPGAMNASARRSWPVASVSSARARSVVAMKRSRPALVLLDDLDALVHQPGRSSKRRRWRRPSPSSTLRRSSAAAVAEVGILASPSPAPRPRRSRRPRRARGTRCWSISTRPVEPGVLELAVGGERAAQHRLDRIAQVQACPRRCRPAGS